MFSENTKIIIYIYKFNPYCHKAVRCIEGVSWSSWYALISPPPPPQKKKKKKKKPQKNPADVHFSHQYLFSEIWSIMTYTIMVLLWVYISNYDNLQGCFRLCDRLSLRFLVSWLANRPLYVGLFLANIFWISWFISLKTRRMCFSLLCK